MPIVSLLTSLRSRLLSSTAFVSSYGANGFNPELVADFVNQKYTGENANTLTTLIDHNSSTAGNATMTGDYGPELVTNGGFDSGDLTGWSSGANVSPTYVDGALQFTGVGNLASTAGNWVSQSNVLERDKTYEITFNAKSVSNSGWLNCGYGYNQVETVYNTATINVVFTTTRISNTDETTLTFSADSGSVWEIDNISVREIPKVQWRPHNLLTYSEDFTNAAWTKLDTTVTSDAAVAPDGTTTADEISHTTTSASLGKATHPATVVGADYTGGVFVKYVDNTWLRFIIGGTSTWFNLSTGAIGTDNLTNSSITSVGSGWYFIKGTKTATGTSSEFTFTLADNDGSTGESTGTSAYIWGAHLYRSDLGGMADVPASERVLASANTYVRTAGREVSGIELVENGTFDTDYTNWVNYNGGTITVSNGELNILTDPSTPNTGVYQQFDTIVGRVYQVSGDVTSVDSTPRLLIGNGIGSGAYVNLSHNNHGETKTLSGTFVAVATTTYISLQTAPVNSQSKYDNISVKEIDVNPATARYLPRIGHHVYNGSQWVNEGLLHESGSRTNLLDYSNDFSTFSNKVQTTVTDEDAVGPDGNESASTAVPSTTSAEHYLQETLTSDTGTFTDSVYAKADGYDFVVIRPVHIGATEGATQTAVFDLSDGTVTSKPSDATAFIEDVGNGWYRCSLTYTISGTITGDFAFRIQVYSAANTATFAGDGTKGIAIYGAQREKASNPSSYIPTSGSTVTRAAETLDIEHENLPWPSPVVIGDELVTNGTFDTDISGWTDGSDAGGSVSWNSSGYLDVTNTTGTARANNTISLVSGKVYQISVDIIVAPAGGGAIQMTPSGGGTTTLFDVDAVGTGTHVAYYVATSSVNHTLAVKQFSAGTSTVDNISVKEINPLSVSIAMDGRVTYTDNDLNSEFSFYDWFIAGNDYLRTYFQTNGGTGKITASQNDGGTFDGKSTGGSDFAPDVLVPYSFAVRHGSTFINMSVDGSSFAANTTPVNLPDASSTDIRIGKGAESNYIGTIRSFRIWANDIGDDGIVEASEPELQPTLSLSFDGTESSFIDFEWSE